MAIVHQGAPEAPLVRPGGGWAPRAPPQPTIMPINSQKIQNPRGVDETQFQPRQVPEPRDPI